MSSRKWLGLCLVVTLLMALVMIAIIYIVDPLNYIRWNDGPRFFNDGRFFIPGIVRNYGAQTYIIGSSMIQNTDMQYLRDQGMPKPVAKLDKAGMTVNEALLILECIHERGQSVDVIISMDLSSLFTLPDVSPSSDIMKEYLYNGTAIDDWMYFFDYDVWYRYLPVTVGMMLVDAIFGRLPDFIEDITNLDDIGRYFEDISWQYDRDYVIENYLAGNGGTTSFEGVPLDHAKRNIDAFIDRFAEYTSDFSSITVGIPPYSALWWHAQKKSGTMDLFLDAKTYFEECLLDLGYVKIADAQSVTDQIADLDHYKDQSHFDLEIQKLYTDVMIANEGTISSADDIEASRVRLEEVVSDFEEKNSEWLR